MTSKKEIGINVLQLILIPIRLKEMEIDLNEGSFDHD